MLQSIYVISGGDSCYKIGISKDPVKRLNTLSIGSPRQIHLKYISTEVRNARKIELELHKKYAYTKIKEEWFVITNPDELINCIKNMVSEIGIKAESKKDSPTEIKINKLTEKFREELISLQNAIVLEKEENYNLGEFLEYLQGLYGTTGKYADLIYDILFGKTVRIIWDQYGVNNRNSMCKHISTKELQQIESMEKLVVGLVNCGWGYDQVKSFIEQTNTKQLAG